MSNYVASFRRPPRCLTAEEQAALLRESGRHVEHFRDHVIFSVALGTALRESEIAALNVGDVVDQDGARPRVRSRIKLRVYKRAGASARDRDQVVFVPASTVEKLKRFLIWKREHRQATGDADPLFVARGGKRLACRSVRHLFRLWQKQARFDLLYPFHALRHTSITNIFNSTKDIRIAQIHARHADIGTTSIYTHPSSDAIAAAVKALRA